MKKIAIIIVNGMTFIVGFIMGLFGRLIGSVATVIGWVADNCVECGFDMAGMELGDDGKWRLKNTSKKE